MDALKHIPDNVNVLKTEKGDARLQKTDIFKKLMWFSYPMEDIVDPVGIRPGKRNTASRIKKALFLPDLGEIVEIESKPVKVLDYENVVGQDSLTRLDERNRNKKKNKNRNKNQGNQARHRVQPHRNRQQEQKPAEASPKAMATIQNKNRNNRRFRPNRNNRKPERSEQRQ